MPTATSAPSDSTVVDWRHYDSLDLSPVLQHSLDAFVEQGYHATTVRDIARRLGQTVPAIYYHYENKQALLVALLTSSINDLLQRCRLALKSVGTEPAERLSELIRCLVLYVAFRRELSYLDDEIRSLEPKNRRPYVKKRDQLEAMVVGVLKEGVTRGSFVLDDPNMAARALITMCRGIVGWYRLDGEVSPSQLADEYVTFALRLVGSQRAGAAAAPGPRRGRTSH